MDFLVVVFWAVMLWGFFLFVSYLFWGVLFFSVFVGVSCFVSVWFGFGFRVVFCLCYLRPMPNSVCGTRWVNSVE